MSDNMLRLLAAYPDIDIPAGETVFHFNLSPVEVDSWKLEKTAFSHPELWWGTFPRVHFSSALSACHSSGFSCIISAAAKSVADRG